MREQQTAVDTRVPWGLPACAGVVVVTALVVVVLVNVIALLGMVADVPGAVELVLLPLPLVVLALVTLTWVRVGHGRAGSLTGPRAADPRQWAAGIGLGLAGFLVVNTMLGALVQLVARVLGVELPEPKPGIREAAADPETLPWVLLSAVVVAPLAEELFFRGMLYQALRRHAGTWAAILVSAVLFAAAHVLAEPTWQGGALVFALILPLGAFLAWLFERHGTLAVPIAAHAAFNAITLVLLLAVAGDGVVAAG
jgi:uncharacterized protein